jgi:DNA-binding SARP family transcriptional activator/streptogramin lyase
MVSEPHLRVSLLGQVAVVSAGMPIGVSVLVARQNRLLFAGLVAQEGRPIPRDELADLIWGEAPPETWEKAVTVIASKVRSLLAEAGLPSSALTSGRGCYQLELPEGTWIDVLVAPEAVQAAEQALEAGDLERATERASLAESLVRAPFLAGEDGEWIDAKRRALDEVRVRALAVLGEASLRSGHHVEAANWAEQAIELEPFRESSYRRLMEARIAAGDRAEALRVYDRCRRLLAEELGAYPSPETEALYRGLLEAPEAASVDDVHSGEPGAVGAMTPAATGGRGRWRLGLAAVILAGAAVAAVLADTGRSAAKVIVPNSVVRVDPSTLKVTEVAPVANTPDLIIKSGGYLWVTNYILREQGSAEPLNAGDRTLTRVDPLTGKAVPVSGGLAPCGMTPDPSGGVWVANCYPATAPGLHDDVVRVAARTLVFGKPLEVPGGSGFFRSLAYGGGRLWASQLDSVTANAVTRIDPKTRATQSIHLPLLSLGLTWSNASGDLWMTNFEDKSLTRLQPATDTTKIIPANLVNPSHSIAGYRAVWVADWSAPQVLRVNAVGAPRPLLIRLPAGTSGVWDIAVGAGAVWATTPGDGALWRIDPKTNSVTRVSIPYRPTGVAADANNVWVTVRK